jgi:hypothetical protein
LSRVTTLLSVPPPDELIGSTVVSTQRPFQWFAHSEEQKFYFLLLCSFVAGKNADTQQSKFDELVRKFQGGRRCADYGIPLSAVAPRTVNGWDTALRDCRMGQYGRLAPICHQITQWSIREAAPTRAELISRPGIGLKTASFFAAYTDLDARVAVLDTHVLASFRTFMNQHGPSPTRPTSPRVYLALEEEFLLAATKERIHPAVLDFELWSTTRTGNLSARLRYRKEWTDQMRALTTQLLDLHKRRQLTT